MKKLFDRYFDAIFIKRDTWVFAGGILLMSLIITTWSAPDTWGEYFGYIGMLTLSYFPVLWFNWNKESIKKQLSRKLYLLVWITAHIVYPFIFAVCQYEYHFFWIPDMPELFQISGVLQLFVALALEVNVFLGEKARSLKWLRRMSLEKGIFLVIGLLSFFIGLIAMTEVDIYVPLDEGAYSGFINFFFYLIAGIRFSSQIFLCFASLYFFYYVNHYLLIPRFLRKRGILIYAASIIGTVVLFYPFFAQLIAWLPLNYMGWDLLPSNDNISFDGINATVPLMVMLLSIPVIIALQWHQQNNHIVSLEKQQTVTELSLLKQQVNPHFFFNTLNNLYALSLKKSKQTPEVIMQLADLMRYVIYKGKESMVPLKGEIQYLQDYIQLQRIRLHKQLDLRFTTDIEDEKVLLPPLLFIILVENAFKHGIEPAENQTYLHINLHQWGNRLVFTCENSLEAQAKSRKPGIGLDNLQRRLELLFPDRHDLRIRSEEGCYKAELSLELSEVQSLLVTEA